ncbi:MAG: hypothetical protein F7C07_04395 [Desulfurococcales archaeon]|nr:hypothetical protein [Desulfurococcales archaeon]
MSLGYLESSILMAVSSGVNTLDELSSLFKGVDPSVLESKLRSLEASGYLRSEVKGFIFKKKVFLLTDKGVSALDEAKKNIEKASIEARKLAREGRPVSEWPLELAMILPLLVWLGFISMATIAPLGYSEEYYGGGQEEGDVEGGEFDVDFGDAGAEF